MPILSRGIGYRASQRALLAISLLVCPFVSDAGQGDSRGFALRNHNPFLQIFGLPPFQSATVAADGTANYDLSLDIVSHAESGSNALEGLVIDGETYFLSLSLRRGVTDRLELGIDLPLVAHAGGFLDNIIENWHDTFGMSNSKRRGPRNELQFLYTHADTTQYELESPSFGFGDIQLTAAMPLKKASEDNDLAVTLRSSIKLPTGDEDELRGSGAADLSAGIYMSDTWSLWEHDLDISGFVGALLLGDGEVLASIQRSAVPYGGIAATWHATDNFGFVTQLYAQGAYFDSELEELGGETIQLAIGADYRLPKRRLLLSFGVVEDIVAKATPDVALHFSIRWMGRE